MMKKVLWGIILIAITASCSGKGSVEKAIEDSALIADSIDHVEEARRTAEVSRQDSLHQDSIAKEEVKAKEAAQYDSQLDEFRTNVNKFVKAVDNWNPDVFVPLMDKLNKMEKKLNKNIKEMTPTQQKEFKSLKSKYQRARNRTAA